MSSRATFGTIYHPVLPLIPERVIQTFFLCHRILQTFLWYQSVIQTWYHIQYHPVLPLVPERGSSPQTYFLVPLGHRVLPFGPEVHHDLPLFPEGHPDLPARLGHLEQSRIPWVSSSCLAVCPLLSLFYPCKTVTRSPYYRKVHLKEQVTYIFLYRLTRLT
jgi:hypothetical protein